MAYSGKEMCTQFLYGSCKFGDACTRKHVELSAINKEAEKRTVARKEDKKTGGNKKDKSTEDKSTPAKPKEKICFQFEANDTCEYGDNCCFKHLAAGQKAKACRFKKQPDPTDLEPGTLVMIPDDSRHPALRGVLGLVLSNGIKDRYRVQLDTECKGDLLTDQRIELFVEFALFLRP